MGGQEGHMRAEELIPFLLVVVSCFTGCSRERERKPPEVPAAAPHSKTQRGAMSGETVRDAARRAAVAEGYDLEEFRAPRIIFDPGTRQWSLFFAGSVEPAPGNHFHVLVDDRTGKASVRHGW